MLRNRSWLDWIFWQNSVLNEHLYTHVGICGCFCVLWSTDVCVQNKWISGVYKHGQLYLSLTPPQSGITRAHCLSHPSVCLLHVCASVCVPELTVHCRKLYEKPMCSVSVSSLLKFETATQQSHSMKRFGRSWMWLLDAVMCCLQWGQILHQAEVLKQQRLLVRTTIFTQKDNPGQRKEKSYF